MQRRSWPVTVAEATMVVLVQFESPINGEDGRSYVARVCGRQAADNMWEGWVEFDPGGGGPVLRTPRETTQPNRPDLEYWATGSRCAGRRWWI